MRWWTSTSRTKNFATAARDWSARRLASPTTPQEAPLRRQIGTSENASKPARKSADSFVASRLAHGGYFRSRTPIDELGVPRERSDIFLCENRFFLPEKRAGMCGAKEVVVRNAN